MVDFIGLGAQKSATSWVYACLYEHPEVCAPVKEIHFFSRDRFEKGLPWYETHFKNCKEGTQKGEFSTSYLYSPVAANRIKDAYPETKLIAILRNPIERAYSQYRNAIKAGEITEETTFETYQKEVTSCLEQGLYVDQLKRYLELFSKEQLLILIQEDARKDGSAFMKEVYRFLGVDERFSASMLESEINVARTPKSVGAEKGMHVVAESMRKVGLDKLVHLIRRTGLPDMIRGINTKEEKSQETYDRASLVSYFKDDVTKLSALIGRDLNTEWNIQ